MKKISCGLLVIVFLLTMILGSMSTSVRAQEDEYEFYLLNVGMNNPYYLAILQGATAASKDYENINLYNMDGREDSGYQANQLTQIIGKGADAVLMDPVTSSALVSHAKRAMDKDIPVFCIDRDIEEPENRILAIGSDQRKIGRVNAKYVVDFLKNSDRDKPWRIAIMQGTPGALANTERTGGWYDILDPYIEKEEIKIVADVACDWAREPAVEKMTQILTKTEDIDVVIASNDQEAAGAITAIENNGLVPGEDIYVTGVDASEVGLNMVERGKMLATVSHQAWLQGYWGFKAAARYVLEDEEPPEGKFEDNYIVTPIEMIDKSNVDDIAGPFGQPADTEDVPSLPY